MVEGTFPLFYVCVCVCVAIILFFFILKVSRRGKLHMSVYVIHHP